MGVTILPHTFFRHMVADGRLCVVRTEMQLPNLEYFATFRNDCHVQFSEEVAALNAEICDFRLQ